MEDVEQWLAKRMEQVFMDAVTGPKVNRHQTALRARGNGFEVIEIDDAGKIIEPPRPCPRCGPVLLCAEHMAMVT